MATRKYTISERLEVFFDRHSPISILECDQIAVSIDPTCTIPSLTQGAFSYTLIGNKEVVQFRAKISPLDVSLIETARKIHGPVVARTILHTSVGDAKGKMVLVYRMERLSGENYSLLNDYTELSTKKFDNQKRTVEGLAMLFAQSWAYPQLVATERAAEISTKFSKKLQVLEKHLPVRFTKSVQHCQTNLHTIFSSEMPWVLTHGYLCDTNLLISPDSGKLTGVPDWAEAEILPFGTALWGLQTLLGAVDQAQDTWTYHSGYIDLETLFWSRFVDKVNSLTPTQWMGIRTAHLIGIFFRHGFKFTGTGEIPKDDTWNLSILDGQLLVRQEAWLTLSSRHV